MLVDTAIAGQLLKIKSLSLVMRQIRPMSIDSSHGSVQVTLS